MEIEKLNKSQIVLLTLLVSFMTSIVTGITTVTLMQQAPTAITETVNRVIERTVEKAVPGQAAAAAAPVTQTVVVKESDQIAQALEKTSPSVVRLYTTDASSSSFLALGIVIDSKGTIATDAEAIAGAPSVMIEMSGSLRVQGAVDATDATTDLVYIHAATSTPDGKSITWSPATFSASSPTLGQTAIAISGRSVARLGQGIITAVSPLADGVKDAVQVIETNITKNDILPGSPIMDTGGNILGISTRASRASVETGFIPSASIGIPVVKDKAATTQ